MSEQLKRYDLDCRTDENDVIKTGIYPTPEGSYIHIEDIAQIKADAVLSAITRLEVIHGHCLYANELNELAEEIKRGEV